MKEIGYNIRDVRLSHRMTQHEFIEMFNRIAPVNLTMSVGDLSKYENGINRISAEKYVKILSLTL